MTVLAAGLIGLVLGAAVVWLAHLHWAEAHHYRRVRLEATRVDVLCHQCDHLERLNRRITDETAVLRKGVGDLLDTVADRDRVIDGLTRRSPIPAYGAARHLQQTGSAQ